MTYNTLDVLIRHFDEAIKDIDFAHLPYRESEEYRVLLLKTADEKMFFKGRYSIITEWTLECFELDYVKSALSDKAKINMLTDEQRHRLQFYLDLKDVCYPLYRGQKIDWTAWPWNMKDGRMSVVKNKEIRDFLHKEEYINLCAAMMYDFSQVVWNDAGHYSSVARNAVSMSYEYSIKSVWGCNGKDELSNELAKFSDDLWSIENHILVGRQLGFDLLTQSIYDAMDTYIANGYRYDEINFALDMAKWIRDNWDINDCHPSRDKLQKLDMAVRELMYKHNVESPDYDYTWNIIIMDVLGVAAEGGYGGHNPWGDDDADEWSDE